MGGEDEEDGWALLRLDAFPNRGGVCGLHAVLCFLVDTDLPDVLLSAHTSCLGGSCFKESSKKYIYICWGFPTGHFLNSSYTSVKRKILTCSVSALHIYFSRQLSPFLLSPPLLSLIFPSLNLGKSRREMGILPLPLIGPLLTLAPVTDNIFS